MGKLDLNLTIPYIIFGIVVFVGFNIYQKIMQKQMLARWSKSSKSNKGVVILHCFKRGTSIPNISPFVLKLETFLRMANIPYKTDFKDCYGPKGKSPWISFNGENIGDSQLIIEFLAKKFDKTLNPNYSEEKLAAGTLARVAVEEHVFWGFVLWTHYDPNYSIAKKIKIPWIFLKLNGFKVKKYTYAQGLGRHTVEEVEKMISRDLRSVSVLLGSNKYFLGDEPSLEIDSAMFGFLSQILWGLSSGSPYEKLVNDELPNIREYCIRMKEKYYSDWNSILDK